MIHAPLSAVARTMWATPRPEESRAMKHFAVALFLLGLCALTPSRSNATDACVIGAVSQRAGPDIGYPRIMTLPAGIPVSVYGCTDGWEWCDVQAEDNRGWVSGQFLQYDYQNQRVLLPDYGARVGIPIVAFVLGTYWEQNYRSRSWYRDRDRWSQRTFVHRPPPRPAYRPQNTQRPPINRPQPSRPAINRPSNPRPQPGNNGSRPPQQISRPSPNQRPMPAQRPSPNQRPMPAQRPSQNQRPAPAQRPAPVSRPSGANVAQRPAQNAAPPRAPAKPVPKKDAKDSRDGGH